MPTVGSLFSGIGGFDLGLERAGWSVRWQVENDPFCQRVLAKHWPDVPRYGDIRALTGAELERVDLIAGGFPCTDISSAGRKVGITGSQSGLWVDMHRIVSVLRPALVFVENVGDLRARGLGRVLGDLAASGYDAEWDCLQAAAVGAPHSRDRLWLLAYHHADRRRLQAGRERYERATEGASERTALWVDADRLGASVSDATGARGLGWRQGAGFDLARWREDARQRAGWEAEPDICRVADGVSPGLDNARLAALGNAVVPQIAEWLGRRLLTVATRGA
jgi:DNA (cytosine-5)-methyltransferase 1